MSQSSVSFYGRSGFLALLFGGLLWSAVMQADEASKTTPTTPADCTTSQYNGLKAAKAYCAKDSYACVSTPYGGCSAKNTPWPTNECSAQCQVTDKAPWLDTSIPKPTGSTDRTLTFDNQCGFDVWAGYTGGYIKGTPSCTQNSDCGISGAVCDTHNSQCFWGIPAMTNTDNTIKRLHLPTSNPTATVTLNNPIHQKDAADAWVKWSGNSWASTDCTGSGSTLSCETATCPDGGCTPFTGPKGVLSLAEFTLQASAEDYYDVSIIGGFNVPVSMKPTKGQTFASSPASASQQTDGLGNTVTVNPAAYWCSEPGSTSATAPLSSCNWSPDPAPTYTTGQMRSVYPPKPKKNTTCSKDSDCTNVTDGASCGLWADSKNKIKQVCGAPRGWWSANEVCAVDPTGTIGSTVFGCDTAVSGQGTQANLYACNGVNNTSGYAAASGITDTLCGCHDWSYPVNGHGCNGSNASWVSIALPAASIKKAACPTAYSYPFDDETSTFNCQTSPKPVAGSGAITANAVDYTITFCPGGLTGR